MAIVTALQQQTCIGALSIAPSQDVIVDRAEAGRIGRLLYSKPLRQLNNLYRPDNDRYSTHWDRFGKDEPWPLRTSEGFAFTDDGDLKVMFGLRCVVHYLEGTYTVINAWSLGGSAYKRALRKVCKAITVRCRKVCTATAVSRQTVPPKNLRRASFRRWQGLLDQAGKLTVDL